MNVGSIIETALAPLGLPVEANTFSGSDAEYITYNAADERPVVYADDSDILEGTWIQVHYFTRKNPNANKKAIRRLLRAAGFSMESTFEIYETDTKFYHVIVSAWIEGKVDDE